MTCGGCVIGTRTVLKRLPGVIKTDVSYEDGSATVTYDPDKVTAEQMITAINTLGYTASVRSTL
jgi:copper chaperone CopZ